MSAPHQPRIRFATVDDLYAAFPTAVVEIGEPAERQPSPVFVDACLRAEKWDCALTFLAYLLGKREAVWWGCTCLRQVKVDGATEEACLRAAEDWVRSPEDQRRVHALDIGMQASQQRPATWIALAAGWSSGNMSGDERFRIAPPPQLTAQAVRAAILGAGTRIPLDQQAALFRNWASTGLRYALDPQSA
ncbi:hypothetical protein [uncultured Alsobacter sp.]|uniref:DUF6931 family protein n=1 Tax=uncultured Alsobacter sp. TaxID=1748258 RepID=UPI0025CF2690|nr:hypothetical protein [uncultured Alsobacter sp.]